jgi:1,4-dihydroxy-2-naphthoate octaprenyltransferase
MVGWGAAGTIQSFKAPLALLALAVALFLQIGVNYANDYSDGIRGTDEFRVGPLRLTGSKSVRPELVKFVAFGFFALAALAGLAIVVITGFWWLLSVGAIAIVAWLPPWAPPTFRLATLMQTHSSVALQSACSPLVS